MLRVLVGSIVALAVLGTAAAVAFAVGSASASERSTTDTGGPTPDSASASAPTEPSEVPDLKPNAQAEETDEGPKDRVPYIGVHVYTLPDAKAEELGIEGGVEVKAVADDSPSVGLLKPGDVIVRVGDEEVRSVRDLVAIVRASTLGETIAVWLAGSDVPVQVTVGETDSPDYTKHHFGSGPFQLYHHLGEAMSKFVSGELVVEEEGGVETLRADAGTVDDVDVVARTVTLTLKNGTGSQTYTVPGVDPDDVLIIAGGHKADIDELEIGEPAIVLTVQGPEDTEPRVKLILQGLPPLPLAGGIALLQPLLKMHEAYAGESGPYEMFEGGGLRELLERLGADGELRERLSDRLGDLPEFLGPLFGDDAFGFHHDRPGVGPRYVFPFPFGLELECDAEQATDDPKRFHMRCMPEPPTEGYGQ